MSTTTNTARPARLEFTSADFVRSHGRTPRSSGGGGSWGFQRSRTEAAFERDLFGEVVWVFGTLTEAKAKLRAQGATGLWSVCP
jgi:hypothetical protein